MSERQTAAGWRVNICCTVIGAVLGNLSAAPMERARQAAAEWYYEGHTLLERGNALRGEAVREGSEAKHKAANAAFQRAWEEAGVPEALAQLGVAACHGFAMPRSWSQGHAMLIEAVRHDGSLGAIYLGGDADVCPRAK